MRILFIAEFSSTGGTRENFKQLLQAHQDLGYTTHVLIPNLSDDKIKEFILSTGATYTCLKRREKVFKKPYYSLLYEWFHIKPEIKAYNPDLILCSAADLKRNFLPFLLQKTYVILFNTIAGKKGWKSSFFYKIPKLFLNKNNYIATVSQGSADILSSSWNIDRTRIDVIYNSYDQKNVADKKSRSGQQLVLTLGHVHDYKNPDIWLKVAEEITNQNPNVSFIWLGGGGRLEFFQKKTSLYPRIQFPGYCPNPKLYYAKADVYFQPSKLESHGRAVVDAMANGLPCITSNTGGLPDNVEEGVNGFLCGANDVRCYINRIQFLLDHEKEKKEMGMASKKIADSKFHPGLLSVRIKDLYSKVLTLNNS